MYAPMGLSLRQPISGFILPITSTFHDNQPMTWRCFPRQCPVISCYLLFLFPWYWGSCDLLQLWDFDNFRLEYLGKSTEVLDSFMLSSSEFIFDPFVNITYSGDSSWGEAFFCGVVNHRKFCSYKIAPTLMCTKVILQKNVSAIWWKNNWSF